MPRGLHLPPHIHMDPSCPPHLHSCLFILISYWRVRALGCIWEGANLQGFNFFPLVSHGGFGRRSLCHVFFFLLLYFTLLSFLFLSFTLLFFTFVRTKQRSPLGEFYVLYLYKCIHVWRRLSYTQAAAKYPDASITHAIMPPRNLDAHWSWPRPCSWFVVRGSEPFYYAP